MYCVKCKNKTESINLQRVVSKNGRPMLRGTCAVCKKVKTQFLSMKNGDVKTPKVVRSQWS